VEIIYKNGGTDISGVIMKDADLVDPTMFVTLIKTLKNGEILGPLDKKFLEVVSIPEYHLLKRINATPHSFSPYDYNADSWYEGNINWISKNFLKGGIESSTDLTGGSLGHRYDYHRPKLMEVWLSEEKEKNFSVRNIARKAMFSKAKNAYSFLPQFRDALNEVMK
jgi:hypothetical protein